MKYAPLLLQLYTGTPSRASFAIAWRGAEIIFIFVRLFNALPRSYSMLMPVMLPETVISP